VIRLLGTGGRALYTRALVGALAITIAIHVAAYMLNAVLPFRATALGATGTQVGLMFSVTAGAAMIFRPVVGGWVDSHGVRVVLVPGVIVLALTSLGLHAAASPGALILLMAGVGLANGLVSTSAGVLASQATAPAHRGEALGLYYLGTSLAVAVAAPAGIALLRLGGIEWNFYLVTVLAALILLFTLSLTPAGAGRPDAAGGGPAQHIRYEAYRNADQAERRAESAASTALRRTAFMTPFMVANRGTTSAHASSSDPPPSRCCCARSSAASSSLNTCGAAVSTLNSIFDPSCESAEWMLFAGSPARRRRIP